jgi:hypothetical protein
MDSPLEGPTQLAGAGLPPAAGAPSSAPHSGERSSKELLTSARLGALGLVLSIVAILWFFRVLVRDAEAASFASVDPSVSHVEFGPGWSDPRWEAAVAAVMRGLPALHPERPDDVRAVEDALLKLPFVAGVGASRVVWPDGLRVSIELRQPVACVRSGEVYFALAADGVILPGAWSTPPARKQGFLPLVALEDEVRGEVWEGNVLDSAGALDALAVAAALERELAADDWVHLGRIVIDAREARSATVENPGVVLLLEGARRVLFGRSPNIDAPGELPVRLKCESLARGLRLAQSGEPPVDWEMVDVRWDMPEVLPRGGLPKPAKKK